MAETKEILRAEVSGVCRNYYLQVWNKAFNQAEVEASSVLRKAENVYYPPAIQASGSTNSKTDASTEMAEVGKASPAKALAFSDNLSEVAQ